MSPSDDPAVGMQQQRSVSLGHQIPLPLLKQMQAESCTSSAATHCDEVAQRFAHFFYRMLATEPEKMHMFYDQHAVRSHLLCDQPPSGNHSACGAPSDDAATRDEARWKMDGQRAKGTQLIDTLIGSLHDQGIVLSLEAVYSHALADGSLIVAAVGLVAWTACAREGGNRKLGSTNTHNCGDTDNGLEDEEDSKFPRTFVEVFVLKQNDSMRDYFVTSDMLHLLTTPHDHNGEEQHAAVSTEMHRLRVNLAAAQVEIEMKDTVLLDLSARLQQLEESHQQLHQSEETLQQKLQLVIYT